MYNKNVDDNERNHTPVKFDTGNFRNKSKLRDPSKSMPVNELDAEF